MIRNVLILQQAIINGEAMLRANSKHLLLKANAGRARLKNNIVLIDDIEKRE